jgi:hypothetical protein
MNLNLKETIKKNKIIIILFSLLLIILFIFSFYPIKDVQVEKELPPLVEEKEFTATIIQITTLDKLITKLNTEFTFQKRDDRSVRSPQEFFELKQGNELDFAMFSAYILKYNGLGEVAIARYKYLINQNQEKIGTVVIFRGHNLPPKYITFGQEGARIFDYGWSFEELWRTEEQRIKAVITAYKIFLLWPLPPLEELWPTEWQQR